MSAAVKEKLRWKAWDLLCKLPNVCPAKAHTLVIYGERCSPAIDSVCREDCARNGACWCGKLRGADRHG